MTDAPFWSDNFDMDLPKVIPNAREIMGDLAEVPLWTTGGSATHGRLNHPEVWNGDTGFIAFFGLRPVGFRDPFYVSTRPMIQCTAWEAFRDAWSHHYLMLVERKPIWNTDELWPEFEAIMWLRRGWGQTGLNPDLALKRATRSFMQAVRALRNLYDKHGRMPQ